MPLDQRVRHAVVRGLGMPDHFKPVVRDARGRIISGHLNPSNNRRPLNWKNAMRAMFGDHGQRAMEALAAIVDGNAWQPVMPDGRLGPPVVPTATDRREASVFVLNALNGKPVSQTEIVAAEQAMGELEAIRALSDEELASRARRALMATSEPAQIVAGDVPAPVTKSDQDDTQTD